MKKQFFLLLLAAILVNAPAAFCFEKGENIIVKLGRGEKPRSVMLQLANLEKLHTLVSLQGADGQVWYTKHVEREIGYTTSLNMDGMPDGDYLLYVENRSTSKYNAFSMTGDDIAFFESKPTVQPSNGVAVKVSFEAAEKGKLIAFITDEGQQDGPPRLGVRLANLQKKPTNINIVTIADGPIFSALVKNEIGYGKALNLTGIASGNYFLYVQSTDATFFQFFRLTKEGRLEFGEIQRLERLKDTVGNSVNRSN
jgi:hypothetical protein